MTNYIVHYMNNYRILHDILHGITCHSMEFVLVPTSWTRLRRQDLRLPPPQGVPTHPSPPQGVPTHPLRRRRRRLGHVRRRRRAGRRPEAPPPPPPAGGGSGAGPANNRQSPGPVPAGRAAKPAYGPPPIFGRLRQGARRRGLRPGLVESAGAQFLPSLSSHARARDLGVHSAGGVE
jgi:hypothetical protein